MEETADLKESILSGLPGLSLPGLEALGDVGNATSSANASSSLGSFKGGGDITIGATKTTDLLIIGAVAIVLFLIAKKA